MKVHYVDLLGRTACGIRYVRSGTSDIDAVDCKRCLATMMGGSGPRGKKHD